MVIMLPEQRAQNDFKALTLVKIILINEAIDLLEKKGVLRLLKIPQSLNSISSICNIKNKKMLETILDLLVGENMLIYYNKEYSIKNINKLDSRTAEQFLQENYKESLDWIRFVNQYSDDTLTTGRPPRLTGFEDEKAIYYWNKIMEQSPYSLRAFAINELYKYLKPNSLILDYGCGSGIGIEQLLVLSTKPITIVGTDPSKRFFAEARKRIDTLELRDKIKEINKTNVVLEEFSNLDLYKGKFDAIFTSIIFNHIKHDKHLEIFKQLNSLLKPGGKLVIVQLLDLDKYKRNPIWIMYNVSSHQGFPIKKQFINDLMSVFPKVEEYLDGVITISTKK